MLEVRNLTKRFDRVTAVQDASLSLREHASAAILGKSGGGKSTFLRLLAGLLPSDSGSILRDGRALPHTPHLRGMAMTFQEPALWNHMTVRENILFGCPAKGRAERETLVEDLAADFGIVDLLGRRPYEISGGQAKRVALARSIACNRDILLLDEPFSNLDAAVKAQAMETVLRRCKGNCTLLLVTHDPVEAEFLCDECYHMEEGVLTKEAAAP